MAKVVLESVYKIYPGDVTAVHDASLEIQDQEFVVLVGPSGCGKSTTLRMVAGLEDISKGSIFIDGKKVNDIPPKDRDIAMVFQNYALYPHMSVYNNMAYGLRNRGMAKPEIDKRVREAAQILEIGPMLDRKPKQLSGGQRQRVAMGRAIVRAPKVFLFDEPLSNLDAKLRVQMRAEIRELQQRLGTTTIYVTHDQTEAMTMADKIAVLNAGRLEQVGRPLELYRSPANLFVAGFIGSPQMNFVSGPLAERVGAGTIGIRPEHLAVGRDGDGWRGRVAAAEHLGSDTFVYVDVPDAGRLTARTVGDVAVDPGDEVVLTPIDDRLHRFDAAGLAL